MMIAISTDWRAKNKIALFKYISKQSESIDFIEIVFNLNLKSKRKGEPPGKKFSVSVTFDLPSLYGRYPLKKPA